MKKLFTLLLVFVAMGTAKAQLWNFSDAAFNTMGTKTETTIINGLTMYATSTASVSVGTGAATFDGVDYTHVFKYGGTGSFNADNITPIQRVISFPVAGPTTITVLAKHASGTAGTADRALVVAEGSKTNELGRLTVTYPVDATVAPVHKGEFSYTGTAATTIFVFSASSGINLFVVSTTGLPTSVIDNLTDALVVNTEYYTLTGTLVANANQKQNKGIYLKKDTYSNGKVLTTKVLIEE